MQAAQPRSLPHSTLGRAVAAGTAAVLLGLGLCTFHYASLPGTAELDWGWLALALAGFAVFAGVLVGLGLGGATAWAVRSAGGPRKVGALRLVAAGIVGGLAGALVPGVFAVLGFGSLDAPYAGTANLVFAMLVASTAFVSLWAPVLWRAGGQRSIAWSEHFGLSALAASLALASFGILGATACSTFGLVPTFEALLELEACIGFVGLALVVSTTIAVSLGAAMGFACWLYLSAALVLERRLH